jgi:transposase
MIPKSIASASVLSWVIIQKFEYHLPFFRQEKLFASFGIIISRQDMANWQQRIYANLKPLFDLLKQAVVSWYILRMDETVMLVMREEGRENTQQSRMWLARGGSPGREVAWYEYNPTRSSKYAKAFLQGYEGYLQTDGADIYDVATEGVPGIIHVGCWAHSRRRFFDAAKAAEQGELATEGINYIKRLYDIERELRKQLDESNKDNKDEKDADRNRLVFYIKRKVRAVPLLKEFKAWLVQCAIEVPPKLLLGKAVSYTLNQWHKLIAYLDSPYLTPDNNISENAIRPFVVNRKNSLFSQCPDGAKSSCGMFTLIETAKLNGVDPLKYLTALFKQAPFASSTQDWEKLLPWNIHIPEN